MATRHVAAGLASLMLLAGCQMAGPGRPPVVSQPTGVEGEWIGTDGVAISSFTGGQFRSTATDTGKLLATGSYQQIDSRLVAITINSVIRQTTSTANCALISVRQMNCTSASGAQFTLVRRA